MTTDPTYAPPTSRPADDAARPPSPSRGVGWLVRLALLAAALGLIGTGAVLVTDPTDQIGAWLQIGAGAGLAATVLLSGLRQSS